MWQCSFTTLLFFLFLIILILLSVRYGYRQKLYSFAEKLQGPKTVLLFGNGLDFLCKKEAILETAIRMTNYRSPSRIWLGPQLVVVVSDPDQLQIIFQSSKLSTKSYIYSFLEPFMGKGLFTASGEKYKNHRKLLQPLFSPRMVTGYSHLFQKHSKKLVNNMKSNVDGPEFDILFYLHDSAFEATMDILLEDKNDHSIDYKNFPGYIRRFYTIFFDRTLKFWLHPNCIYNKTDLYREQQRMLEIAHTITQEVVDTRVREISQRLENHHQKDNEEIRPPSVMELILEMVANNSDCLTERECIDHMFTFMATSQDTQSTAIAFTCMMLGMYPDIQDGVFAELKQVLGERTNIDFMDVAELNYMEMCIKESLRLFPVAPFVFRDTTEDFKMDKWIIPKNVIVTLGIYKVHRDPQHWEKPEEFYPGHFTEEATKKRHPYAFIPFSAGPRRCIAQHYSYTNMKIIIGTLLLNYIFYSEKRLEDIKLMTDVSIRPVDGYLVKIRNRH